MEKLTFYPLGNADTCLVEVGERKLLFDYAAMADASDDQDLRIDLPQALRKDLGSDTESLDVVAFTHLDSDHTKGSTEFFHLDHATKYQGEGRLKIGELWVPAAAIVEEGAEDEARVLRQEARHRLLKGYGIKVFSRPALLEGYLQDNNLEISDREHLIVGAGSTVPGWTLDNNGMEVFVHSPFAERDGDKLLDRNVNSIVVQLTFSKGDTRVLLSADTTWDNWERIVKATRSHDNDERLAWDLFKLPHHCSYLSLSSEKGARKTNPTEDVEWLLQQARDKAIAVSTSWRILGEDQTQPPHFQARRAYLDFLGEVDGKFIVTMEHPKASNPERLVVEVTEGGVKIPARAMAAGVFILSRPAPRVG